MQIQRISVALPIIIPLIVLLLLIIFIVCLITSWFNLVKNFEKMTRIHYEILKIIENNYKLNFNKKLLSSRTEIFKKELCK